MRRSIIDTDFSGVEGNVQSVWQNLQSGEIQSVPVGETPSGSGHTLLGSSIRPPPVSIETQSFQFAYEEPSKIRENEPVPDAAPLATPMGQSVSTEPTIINSFIPEVPLNIPDPVKVKPPADAIDPTRSPWDELISIGNYIKEGAQVGKEDTNLFGDGSSQAFLFIGIALVIFSLF